MFDPTFDNSGPLQQGDIIRLKKPTMMALTEKGIAPYGPNPSTRFAMVISRPCIALNEKHIAVACLRPANSEIIGNITKAQSDGNALDLKLVFEAMRDGELSKNSFYLGCSENLSDDGTRWVADFRQLVTVHINKTNGEMRTEWVRNVRVESLVLEARLELARRLWNFFSYQGFDDTWWSEEDLRTLVNTASLHLSKLEMVATTQQTKFPNTEAKKVSALADFCRHLLAAGEVQENVVDGHESSEHAADMEAGSQQPPDNE